MKNFVDWASRPPGGGAFIGKPVALIGASTGRVGGTVQAQGQLRISLAVIGAHVMPSPPILVAEAHTRFDEELLIDEPTDKILGIALSRFLDFIDALGPRVPADSLRLATRRRSAPRDHGVVTRRREAVSSRASPATMPSRSATIVARSRSRSSRRRAGCGRSRRRHRWPRR